MGYYVRVESNVNIYVEDLNPSGNLTIVFLHGWPYSHRMFEYQFNELSSMGCRCIGIDMRGFGCSDKPLFGYDFNRLSDDVRLVVQALGIEDFILAGHSVGGAIAIKYMSRHRGYGVSKLALFAAAAPSFIKRDDFPYGMEKQKFVDIIKDIPQNRPQVLSDLYNIFFFKHTTRSFSNWFLNLGLQSTVWSMIAVANTLIDEVLFYDISTITVPTLILHGIHDKIVSFHLGEVLNHFIKGSKLVQFMYSGHGLFYDEKKLFNLELLKFLNDNY